MNNQYVKSLAGSVGVWTLKQHPRGKWPPPPPPAEQGVCRVYGAQAIISLNSRRASVLMRPAEGRCFVSDFLVHLWHLWETPPCKSLQQPPNLSFPSILLLLIDDDEVTVTAVHLFFSFHTRSTRFAWFY